MASESEIDAWRAELIERLNRLKLHVSDHNIECLAAGDDVTLSEWDLETFADEIMSWAEGKSFPDRRRGISYGRGPRPGGL